MIEYFVGPVVAAWIGSVELRLGRFVSKDRFEDLMRSTCRLEKKVDALLTKNGLDPKTHGD